MFAKVIARRMSTEVKGGAAAYWKFSGLSYLQYVQTCTRALQSCLKEPAKTRSLERTKFSYNKAVGNGEKVAVKSD